LREPGREAGDRRHGAQLAPFAARRAVFLVTTVNPAGWVNVAPKSLITFVTVRPPRIALGCSRHHHTSQNLLANGECVPNLPGDRLAPAAWRAAEPMTPGPGEVEARGLTPLPALRVAPPRLAECGAHIECRLESVQWFGDECVLLLGAVAASADEEACAAEDPYAVLRPIFFFEPGRFGTVTATAHVQGPGRHDGGDAPGGPPPALAAVRAAGYPRCRAERHGRQPRPDCLTHGLRHPWLRKGRGGSAARAGGGEAPREAGPGAP
jgi:flavin reductase (DIM6/NTAB) family NADH-FMN oxidoreductase RutF